MADSFVGYIDLWRSEEMQLVQAGTGAARAQGVLSARTRQRGSDEAEGQAGHVRSSRSERDLCVVPQMMVPSEAAHDTVAALGDLGLMQFKDLNAEKSAFQRSYASQVPATSPLTCSSSSPSSMC